MTKRNQMEACRRRTNLGVLPGLACLVQVVLGGVVGCVRVGLACCELRGLDVVEGLLCERPRVGDGVLEPLRGEVGEVFTAMLLYRLMAEYQKTPVFSDDGPAFVMANGAALSRDFMVTRTGP